ncbi:major facilitator superfamily domain-containing protein [Phyllosticta citriasiana]|uniref:Major facilitator superfamily domain-containing protein n=1 Tax=Phyllosticta citriasiana TaxID=595635 RepID=A0ABR1KWL4_9PEZI
MTDKLELLTRSAIGHLHPMADSKQPRTEVQSSPEFARETFHDGSEQSKIAFLASFSASEDKQIMRKVDRRFLVLIGRICLIENIDYTNAATVKVLQVGQSRNVMNELHMTADQYNWVQSMYFISYIIFEVPCDLLLLERVSPRNWQTRIILSWGAVLACHAAVKNKEGYYAARWFLGMMEAGMFPGLAAQLRRWYTSDEIGESMMWMFALQHLSSTVGGLLAFGISNMNGLSRVYLLEDLATMLLGVVVFLAHPDHPKSPRSRW